MADGASDDRRGADAACAALAPAMREICGPADVLTDPLELRTYECDGLTSHRTVPALVVLPETAAEVAAVVRAARRPACRSSRAAAAPACPAARCRTPTGVLIVMSRMRRDPRGRPGVAARGGRARRDQPVGDAGRGAARPVLRARPVVAGGLLGGRERRGELRRRALPQARVHGQPRARPGDRHARRRADLARRRHRRGIRLRPARRVHRLGGHARHRHQDRRQADPGRRGGAPGARRATTPWRRAGARSPTSSPPASCPPRSR